MKIQLSKEMKMAISFISNKNVRFKGLCAKKRETPREYRVYEFLADGFISSSASKCEQIFSYDAEIECTTLWRWFFYCHGFCTTPFSNIQIKFEIAAKHTNICKV